MTRTLDDVPDQMKVVVDAINDGEAMLAVVPVIIDGRETWMFAAVIESDEGILISPFAEGPMPPGLAIQLDGLNDVTAEYVGLGPQGKPS